MGTVRKIAPLWGTVGQVVRSRAAIAALAAALAWPRRCIAGDAVARVPHVLIVDDDRPMRSMLASQLRIDGFIVHEAPNVLSARLVLDGMVPPIDLVVLDIHLPGGSGLELATRLRAESPELPIVLMTAFPDQGMKLLAHSLRVRLLGKPFEIREFRAIAGEAAHWSS